MSLRVWVLWVVGIASLVGVCVIGFIGLRLAVHRHQVHTPALSGPCSFLTQPVRPSGASLKLRRLSWYLSAVRLPQSGPWASPPPLCSLRSFLPLLASAVAGMRGLHHGAPPGWPPSAALLSCFLQANTQRPTRSKKPAIRLRGTDWCLHGGFASFVPHLLCRHSRPQPSGGTAPLAAAVPSTMLQGPASMERKNKT